MAIIGKVSPPNILDVIIEDGKPTQDMSGWMNNLSIIAPISGNGSPEGAVEAPFLVQYTDIDAIETPGTFQYIKTTRSGKTGWKLT